MDPYANKAYIKTFNFKNKACWVYSKVSWWRQLSQIKCTHAVRYESRLISVSSKHLLCTSHALLWPRHYCNSLGEKLGGCIHVLRSARSGLSAFTGAPSCSLRTSTENVKRAPARSGSASGMRVCDVPAEELFGLRSAIRASTLNGRIFGRSPSSSTLMLVCISPLTPRITRECSSALNPVAWEVMVITGAIYTTQRCEVHRQSFQYKMPDVMLTTCWCLTPLWSTVS